MPIYDWLDFKDLKGLPSEFANTFSPSNMRAKGYPLFTLGDFSAFLTLFFDNIATQMGLISAAVFVIGFTPEFVYSHFMGGVGVSLLFGNVYYSLQASKVAMQTGKMDTCAQPYGINTPGALGKTFSVLLPAFGAQTIIQCGGGFLETSACTPSQLETAMEMAWSAACCANFIGGLIEFAGAFFMPTVLKTIPYGAVLVPIGGVGMTWLGYQPFASIFGSHQANFPAVGLIPLVIIWSAFFGSPRMFGPIPAVVGMLAIGIGLYAIVNSDGYADGIEAGAKFVGKGGIAIPDFAGFDQLSQHVSLIASLAFTNFVGTYACNIQARLSGDVYSPMETMMVDGVGSMLGALFGSPYGTTVYIGHTTFKKFGATRGYSLLNGVIFFIMGLTGLHALVDAIMPHELFLGVLVCVGFLIAGQCVEVVPPRWYPAVMLGLSICFSDYMDVNGADNVNGPGNDIKILAPSYVWVSCLWTFLLMMLIDRWYLSAGNIFLLLSVLTTFGVIHSSEIGLVYDGKGHHAGADPEVTKTWKLIVSYGIAAAFLWLYAGLQRFGKAPAAETEDFRALQIEKYSAKSEELPTTTTIKAEPKPPKPTSPRTPLRVAYDGSAGGDTVVSQA